MVGITLLAATRWAGGGAGGGGCGGGNNGESGADLPPPAEGPPQAGRASRYAPARDQCALCPVADDRSHDHEADQRVARVDHPVGGGTALPENGAVARRGDETEPRQETDDRPVGEPLPTETLLDHGQPVCREGRRP